MTKPDTSAVSEPVSEPLLDLRQFVMGIRQRRRMVVAAGLVGLLAGALLAMFLPPEPTALARLIVIHEGDQPSDPGTFIRTDVALLQTTQTAAAALRTLGSNENPDDFLDTYRATALTNNVLEVRVRGSSDDDAVARAKALADVFIADHIQQTKTAADAQAQTLIDRLNQTKAELAEVEAKIATTPRAVKGESAAAREALIARRVELSAQSAELTRRVEDAVIGAPRVAAGTRIVDGPRALDQSLAVIGLLYAGIGLALGVAAGLALAATASVVQDRPMLRNEIAKHLGASVLAQLPAPRNGPLGWWRRSRAVAERKRVAATLARAVPDGAAFSLLELGCPRVVATLAVDIAEKLAATGPVVVVNGLPGRYLKKLPDHSGNRTNPIQIEDIKNAGKFVPVSPDTRRIGIGSVAPGTAWIDLDRLGSQTVLVVRAGSASMLWLHTVARRLAYLQISVIGVVLVNPDPRDHSDGMLWDGPYSALRGRTPLDQALRDRARLDGKPLTPDAVPSPATP